jgi:hypothetical protein
MSKDLLSEATRALRETGEVSEIDARATRARVMGGLHQTRVRRRTRYAFLLPIAATFVAASAWGAASGKAQLVWASLERMAHISAPTQTPAPSPTHKSTSALPPVPVPQPDLTPTPAPETPSAKLAHTVPGASAPPHPGDAHSTAPLTPQEAADPTLALYRVAHTAHFVDHDPARALQAWDAYLAAAPNGAFAPEAHYNRALSLVRLGRNSEARSALEPFANGSYGGYRQAEASALLERIGP